MPTKQGIEAELNASEQHKANAEARATLVELDEFETMLRAAEREIWQPHWSHDDPLADRLTRIRAHRRRQRPFPAPLQNEPTLQTSVGKLPLDIAFVLHLAERLGKTWRLEP